MPFVKKQTYLLANELTRQGVGTYRISTFMPNDDVEELVSKVKNSWESTEELESRTPHIDEDKLEGLVKQMMNLSG